MLQILLSHKWVFPHGQGVEITKTGIVRLSELRERRKEESRLPWMERQLRRKTKMWNVTVSTLVQVGAILISLVSLVVAILALQRN